MENKKVVVISGGSDGLGKEIARLLAPDHTVIILSASEDKLKTAASELGCVYRVCDVTNAQMIDTVVAGIIRDYQKIDCLVNNAGVWIEGEIETNSVDQIKKAIDINTLGTIFLTRAVLPGMKSRKAGKIVTIISGSGLKAKPKKAIYAASKFALTGFVDGLRQEVAAYNIAVTGIFPGKLNTGLFAKQGITKPMDDALEPKEVAKTVLFVLSLPESTVLPEITIQHILA